MSVARAVFTQLVERWLADPDAQSFPAELLNDDVVVEMPLAPPGWPQRIEGRDQFVALAEAGRRAMPVRFHDCRDVIVHDTADAASVVVEYQLAGTLSSTGEPVVAPVITLLRIHDGRIVTWREYHNLAALLREPAAP